MGWKSRVNPLQAFTIMDQNRDGFIDKNDLRDTFAALGQTNKHLSLRNNSRLQTVLFKSPCRCLQDV